MDSRFFEEQEAGAHHRVSVGISRGIGGEYSWGVKVEVSGATDATLVPEMEGWGLGAARRLDEALRAEYAGAGNDRGGVRMAIDPGRIRKGMRVRTSDGIDLGRVAEVRLGTDPSGGEVEPRLVVRYGLLGWRVLSVPLGAVSGVSGEVVILAVD